MFLPTDAAERERCKAVVATICAEEGQVLVGWRVVPTNADGADLGQGAREAADMFSFPIVGGDTGKTPSLWAVFEIANCKRHEVGWII